MNNLINGALPAPKQMHIRFVNNQGQPPSKRRRINAACLTCRKRKTRCAGERPVCTTCTKNGHHCLGYTDITEKLVKKERDGDDSLSTLPKGDNSDSTDPGNEHDDDFLDEQDFNERRHWKSKPPIARAGFVDHDAISRRDSASSATVTSSRTRARSNEWDQDDNSQTSNKGIKRNGNYNRTASHSEDGRSSSNRSPATRHAESHRMPYFRYFGPTAIVPGFKQMVVDVAIHHRDRRRSRGSSFSATSPGSSLFNYGMQQSSFPPLPETILESMEDMPVYDVNDPGPVHPLIVTLVKTFFLHLGCNYLFLREDRFLRMLKEKRLEPILVDAVCALAARFSDLPIFTNEHDGKEKRSEYGHVFAQRAKAATVDTFPCPSVAAVQACLLMAYEGFGANQDSALWMYLGLAIRMAVDLGLQKMEGVKYQGERDPWYTRGWGRRSNDEDEDGKPGGKDLSPEEQREVEQERIDTFWAVFVLDRVISSGTGRPVTFRDDDFELALPEPTTDPTTGWPAPFPTFIEIIHLYGRVSDVLNNIRDAKDLTEEKMAKLAQMESDLTAIYEKQDARLHFNPVNFREYVRIGQGTTFILLHFWFHALIIVLHQPTLLTPLYNQGSTHNSRELSMSSAKTIADILAFAELIDPKSFIGNPFTSQPMYIAACAFLMESVANSSQPPSRETSPAPGAKETRSESNSRTNKHSSAGGDSRPTKHSLLASAANQNYQRCYKSLQQLQQYWGGVGYILTALDQKSKGIWDCETFTNEEYEATKLPRRGSLGRLPYIEYPASPNVQVMAYSLTGTTNSPNSSLTMLFQNNHPGQPPGVSSLSIPTLPPTPHHSSSVPVSAPTPPGNMKYDPIRQSLPDPTTSMYPPPYPQANMSAVRHQSHPSKSNRLSQSPALGMGKTLVKFESSPPADMDMESPSNDHKALHASLSGPMHAPPYTPSSHNLSVYEASVIQGSPSTTPTDSGMGHHGQGHDDQGQGPQGYEADFAQSGLASGSYYLNPINEIISFNHQEVNFDMIGLQTEMMPPWLEILPGEVLGGLLEGGMSNNSRGYMG